MASDCRVKKAFNQYVSRVTKVYNETSDVVRCGKMEFKEPRCTCDYCIKKSNEKKIKYEQR